VQRVLDALGFPEALVTDESLVGDFTVTATSAKRASERLGVEVSESDYVVDVAERLGPRLVSSKK
jgi:hypothetical protein